MLLTAAMTAATAQAQQTVTLGKGDTTVAKFELNDGDYVTFDRPAGAEEQNRVEVTETKTGKNYINYTVITAADDQRYGHMLLQSSFLELYLTQYYGQSLSTVEDATLKQIFKVLFSSGYGYINQGSLAFEIKDGMSDGGTGTFFVPAGQEYYIVTVDCDADYKMGNNVSYTKVKTVDPDDSTETIDVEYKGLDSDGNALVSVTPSAGIATLHTVFGTKKSIDQFVNVYGYNYLMFGLGDSFTAEQWNSMSDSDKALSIDKEDDYTFLALGIDENGDWVKNQIDLHFKPANTTNLPEVDVTSKTAGEGAVNITFSVTPKDVSKATVRLIGENALNNELNTGKTLADVAAEEATDITDTVKANGEYTFSQSDITRGWYAVLCAATNDYGTTVTKAVFHTHLENFEWETSTKYFPVDDSNNLTSVKKKSHKPKTVVPTECVLGLKAKLKK